MKQPVNYVSYEITTPRDADNKRVHEMFRNFNTFYASPYDALSGKKIAGRIWWDVWMASSFVQFVCTFPEPWEREVLNGLKYAWPAAEFTRCKPMELIPGETEVVEMKYRRNSMFALQTDRRLELEPLQSILSVTNDLTEDDLCRYSVCAQPVGRVNWQDWVERQFEVFKTGKTPKRTKFSTRDILVGAGEFLTSLLEHLMGAVETIIGEDDHTTKKRPKRDQDDYEKRLLLVDGSLTRGTMNKRRAPTFNVWVRLAAQSPDRNRAQMLVRLMSTSFNDLTADNELERCEYHPRIAPVIIREMNTYRITWPTIADRTRTVMSNEEAGRLVELPTAALQDQFPGIDAFDPKRIAVPAVFTKEHGLYVGDVHQRKQNVRVLFPTSKRYWDDIGYSTVVIGGKGQGKTKGFACNRAVEYVKAGWSSIVFDAAKSEAWDVISKALKPQQRRRYLLGEQVIRLDFNEILTSADARGRLSEIVLSFFEDHTDTAGSQTQRFLQATVMAMRTGLLYEIVRILNDRDYRADTIAAMPEMVAGDMRNFHRDTLAEFHGYSADRQRQIVAPIMNRLNVILGNPYLSRCLQASEGVNMTDIIRTPGVCTVFDIPDRLNSRYAKDVLVSLLSFKLDIATPQRTDEQMFPVGVFYDEPHQYLRSATLWRHFIAEARKYRMAYHFMFHSFSQLPTDMVEILKDAGCHYVVYQPEETTFNPLKRQLAPFTLDEALAIPKHHAICALKCGDSRLPAFIAHMPSEPQPIGGDVHAS